MTTRTFKTPFQPAPSLVWRRRSGSSLIFGIMVALVTIFSHVDSKAKAQDDGLAIIRSAVTMQEGATKQRVFHHAARRPVIVEVDLSSDAGAPRIPAGFENEVIAALDANPRRLVTLEFSGAPLRFADLPRGTRDRLLQRGGPEVSEKYDAYLSGQVLELIESVRARRASAPLSVKGIPWEGGRRADRISNRRFEPVVAALDAFVMRQILVLSRGSDETAVFERTFATSMEEANGRAILYPANIGWRIALDGSIIEAGGDDTISPKPGPTGFGDASGRVEASDESAVTVQALGAPSSEVSGLPSESETPGTLAGSPLVGGSSSGSSSDSRPAGEPSLFGGGSGGGVGGAGSSIPPVQASEEDGAESTSNENAEIGNDGVSNFPTGGLNDPYEDVAPIGVEDPDDAGDTGGSDWNPVDEIDPADDSDQQDDPVGGGSGADPNDPNDPDDSDQGNDDSSDDLPSDDVDGGHSQGFRPGDELMAGVGETAVISSWESFASLQSMVNNAPEGGTLDLRGRGFAAEGPGETINTNGKSLRFRGGHYTGAMELDWTSLGGGLFAAPIDASIFPDLRLYLLDQTEISVPRMAVVPKPDPVIDAFRFAYSHNWWTLRASGDISGDVLTDRGINASGGRITGFIINDPQLLYKVSQVLAEGQAGSYSVLYHAGPNLVAGAQVKSWSPSEGRLDLVEGSALSFNGYVHFALTGSPAMQIDPGEYVIDGLNEQVVYRPKDGDPSGVRLPVLNHVFRVRGGAVAFEDATISGGRSGNSSYLLSAANGNRTELDLLRCHLHTGDTAVSGATSIIRSCVFERLSDRGININDGSIVRNNIVRGTEGRSCLVAGTEPGYEDVPMRHTLVEGNYFSAPAATHGQGVSLYSDTWQNATVTGNIFHNLSRSISFQPNTNASKRRDEPGSFVIENNLICYDDFFGIVGGGQQSMSFNGAPDDHLDAEQIIAIRHNTMYLNQQARPSSDPADLVWFVDVRNLKSSTVFVEHNILGSVDSSVDDGVTPGHWHCRNIMMNPNNSAAFGRFDLATPSSVSLVHTGNSLKAVGPAAFSAADGGCLGIRWSSVPEFSDLYGIELGWTETFSPEAVSPAPAGLQSRVHRGQDLR